MSSDYKLFVDDEGGHFLTPNAQDPPPTVPDITTIDSELQPHETLSLQWSSNRYPFLGFVPVTPEFSGPLLGRLAYDFRTLPIAQADGLFFLDPVLRECWLRLEVGLYSTAWRLYDLIPGRGPFTSYFAFYPHPSEFGFTRMHKSERIARKCTMISRDAFVPLMAMVSHAIVKQYDREPDRRGSFSLDSGGQTV